MSPPGILGYHEASKHSPQSVRRSARGLDWPNKPFPYKDYAPGLPSIGLPMPDAPLPLSALDAVAGLGPASARALDVGEVGRILNYGAGVMRKRPISPTQAMYFRTYASAGGLYPVEIYAVSGDLPGVEPGVYHYHPRRRALVSLREGDHRGSLVEATASEPAVAEAPLALVLTGIPWRTAWKYGPRGFRHLYWDAGMILANLLALTASAGLPSRVVAGFDDAAVERLLGVDGRHEVPLCLLIIGAGSPAPPPAQVPELALASRPLSPEEIEYPEIVAAQDSGRLGAADVATWRGSAGPSTSPAERVSGPREGPLKCPDKSNRLENVIRRRGSARSFDREPIPVEALATILDRATRGVPADWAPGGSPRRPSRRRVKAGLVEPYLIANRMDGLEAGAYRYDGTLRLLRAGDFARQATYLCLEQPLGGDAAATHFLMADLAAVLGRLGDRGYRAAQLEAGVVAGRMYLAAEAHRLGATGLTFYDDYVTRFFAGGDDPADPPRSCMLVLALGAATRRLLPLA
jgi:SagB-type dehydrogenase family enzyme